MGVWLSKNTARSMNLGYRFMGNFALMTVVFACLEIALSDLFAGPFWSRVYSVNYSITPLSSL